MKYEIHIKLSTDVFSEYSVITQKFRINTIKGVNEIIGRFGNSGFIKHIYARDFNGLKTINHKIGCHIDFIGNFPVYTHVTCEILKFHNK